jgi:electron transport complex protein RnfG
MTDTGNATENQAAAGGAPPPPERKEVPAWRLLSTLGTAGMLAGLLLVFVFRATQPAILAYKAEVLRQAVQQVLKAPDRYDTLYVYDGSLERQPPAGADVAQLEQVYVGYTSDNERIGFAIAAGKAGFQDIVRIIFGYDAATRQVLGMLVLESKETPGLGDKIEKDESFVEQFDGALAPLLGVKSGASTGDPTEIEMITGATISSRTIINIINETLERLGPLIDAYGEEDGGP